MAIYFAPKEETFGEGFGKAVGGSLAQGISQRMQKIADMKMQDYAMRQQMNMQQNQQRYQQQQQRQNNFQALSAMLPNMSEQQRLALSSADPAMLSKFVTQKLQQEGNVPLAQFMFNALGGQQNAPDNQQPPQDQQETPSDAVQGQQQSMQGEQPVQPFQGMNKQGQPKITPEMLAALPRNDLMAGAKFMQKGIEGQKKEQRALTASQEKKLMTFHKEQLPYYEKIRDRAETAQDTGRALQSMLDAVDRGNLPTPVMTKLAEGLNGTLIGKFVNINGLLGTDAEKFQKDATELFKGAKAIFGSRITDLDFSNFLKSIPTLINTDEGKRRIIKGLQLLNQIAEARYKVAQDIKEKNGGYLPYNFDTLVNEQSKNDVDRLSHEFTKIGKYGPEARFKSPKEAGETPEETILVNHKTGERQKRINGEWKTI